MKNFSGSKNPNFRGGAYSLYKHEGNSWRAMIARCEDKNYWAYKHYGGRGIKVCKRWKSFENFLADMGPKPTPKHSIDRIDNDKDYCPDNCRWATQKEQVCNSSKKLNARLTSEEIKMSLCSPAVMYERLRNGWDKETAIKAPPYFTVLKRHEKYLESLPNCLVCGKKCKHPKAKYCSRKCYRSTTQKNNKMGDDYREKCTLQKITAQRTSNAVTK